MYSKLLPRSLEDLGIKDKCIFYFEGKTLKEEIQGTDWAKIYVQIHLDENLRKELVLLTHKMGTPKQSPLPQKVEHVP